MYFFLSKTVGLLTVPSNAIVLLAVAGVVLGVSRFALGGDVVVAIAVGLLVIVGFSPFGNLLITPLEQRFPPWSAAHGAPDGIIVLAGGIEHVATAAALERQFPQARIVLAGGNASLIGGPREAMLVLPLLEKLGLPRSRLELESASRTTYENALFTAKLINPKPGERWLLVTSASHMPRAVGCFRCVGLAVEAFPVIRTPSPRNRARPFGVAAQGLEVTDTAMREWIGLIFYWLTGRSSELFPRP